ncbi:MAG: cupin domain-containing protein [Bacteroidales bacterium]|nr:cupin domain-containing protein [Bacteroidales bacterium]
MKKSSLATALKIKELNAYQLMKNELFETIHLELLPGEGIPLHPNPQRVLFYVLSGEGMFYQAESDLLMKQDDSIDVPAGAERSWKNTGTGSLKLLVVKFF